MAVRHTIFIVLGEHKRSVVYLFFLCVLLLFVKAQFHAKFSKDEAYKLHCFP